MVWKIEVTREAEKGLARIDKQEAERIIMYLRKRVVLNPRQCGKALQGDLSCLWRYRIGDYRVLCAILRMLKFLSWLFALLISKRCIVDMTL